MKQFYFTTLLLTLFSFSNLFATDYYIDANNGNDGNSGLSSTNAFRSLLKVDNLNLLPGDTVFFMEGTYRRPGQTLLTIDQSGTEDNYITFTNFEDQTPILEFNSWTGIDIIGGSSYLKFDGLQIKGARSTINLEDALNQGDSCASNFSGGAEGLYNGTGILAVGPNLRWSNPATTSVPHHITVTNCQVYDCTSSGMAFQQADYVTITNNEVYNNCWYTIYGTSGINLYQLVNIDGTTGFHNTVTNNLMYGNQMLVPQVPFCAFFDGNALIVDDFNHTQTGNYLNINNGFDPYSAKSLIANNVSVENGGSGLHFFLSANCYILNNTVVNNASQNDGDNGNAELRIGSCNDFVIKNNIFKSEDRVHAFGGNTNINYTHNYQNGPGIRSNISNCDSCLSESDIEFSNTNINSSQPYITNFSEIFTDAGINLTEINDDFLGNARPNGASFDIGAYELFEEGQCIPSIWYADTDNDGFGDVDEFISACEQPEGYVDNDSDLCIDDINKQVPGECGCGVEENTCNDEEEEIEEPIDTPPSSTGDLCDSAEYDNNVVYAEAGNVVVFEGSLFENQWYAQGLLPTSGGPWKMIGFCNAEPSDCSSIELWSATTIYAQAGTQVIFNQNIYENSFYITATEPNESEAWNLVGFCGISSSNSSAKSLSNNSDNTSYLVTVYTLAGTTETQYTSDNNNNDVSHLKLPSGMYIIQSINTENGESNVDKVIIP